MVSGSGMGQRGAIGAMNEGDDEPIASLFFASPGPIFAEFAGRGPNLEVVAGPSSEEEEFEAELNDAAVGGGADGRFRRAVRSGGGEEDQQLQSSGRGCDEEWGRKEKGGTAVFDFKKTFNSALSF
ncbi:hypothetical protein CRG98_033785 [Punica granatum]|uniref:Uncharacterized protein n=1 Tax=Punica granatum TaxID=22663 RepID=A0A2I0IP52_PUNGR|nr:hypothetical protein CRG98_033785 [Punica granatum]